ncbi:related to Anaphase-promoting complex subunit cut9 [Saccharomycodes ludwigii]|uniref:Related to Anaphase-promoting complex subunit cut9 n=1 Tax=Saccharomycodes ludwigii TaxID=36035 RepID=A0A376B238_9ASCO|nr:related to Anaphase-promoting complex subunit cut9 [Saccharomycodes ludwigii]
MHNNNNTGQTPSHNTSTLAISPLVTRTDIGGYNRRNRVFANNNHLTSNNLSANLQTPFKPILQNNTNNEPTTNTANPLLVNKSPFGTPHVNPEEFSNLLNANTTTAQNYNLNMEKKLSDEIINENNKSMEKLSSAERLRLWRHDALMQHHYKTAEFVGDKVYSITKDPNDAFWLAQVYYNDRMYIKAINFLSRDNLYSTSIICQYLCALCLVNLEKYDEALELIGETNPFRQQQDLDSTQFFQNAQQSEDGGIKLESSLCFLRGKIYTALNNLEFAKECFKEAVFVDVKNFEAFDTLISNYFLSPAEQWSFFQSLDFESQLCSAEDIELIKSLYTIKLSKYLNMDTINAARNVLDRNYNFDELENGDYLTSEAEELILACNYQECLKTCEKVIAKDPYNFKILPIYISCLYELGGKNKLFQISHKLAEDCSKNGVSWYSVGVYYLSTNKITEARKYFSKSSILDPNLCCSWIGFGHTYAAEGEHEQAIAAYSTAARFFPGSHLPNLFLGIQYILMDSFVLAEEYLMLAYDICPYDPLLLNEIGVVFYQKSNFIKAKKYFKKAWDLINKVGSNSKSWVSIHVNLGHTYRKLNELEKAVECFKLVFEVSKKDENVYSSLGLIYLKMNKLEKSIDVLHKSLALQPSSQIAQELLDKAMEVNLFTDIDKSHPLVVSSKFTKYPSSDSSEEGINEKRNSFNKMSATEIANKIKMNYDSDSDSDMEVE